ncbi:hypothetical protein NE865_16012 [Phthorimaea operculella]|nr:hypothetical protein NE865_16012 [Phthorimaea operculella]
MRPGAWRQRVSRAANNKTSPQVIFACCAVGWDAVEKAAKAAKRCATQCRAAHSRLVPPHGQWRAARWLSDDDIERFLQSLPNWRAVTATQNENKPTAQELTQAYEREAEIIGSSLGDGAVSEREIMSDMTTLADIALMAESMDWLSANIKSLPSLVSSGGGLSATKSPLSSKQRWRTVSDQFVHDTRAAAAIFDEIQHKCLLLLHLELRIQCFHYLGQEEAEGAEESDSAGGASHLARALLQFHEQASALGRQRLAYVLGGIGEMMSAGVWVGVGVAALRHCLAALGLPPAGLHRAMQYLHLLDNTPQVTVGRGRGRGAETLPGRARPAARRPAPRHAVPAPAGQHAAGNSGSGSGSGALRHCLAALGLPPAGLHRAMQYLHLLDNTPQEIIASIREHGAQFSELEYLNALKVVGARLNLQQSELKTYLHQLSAALGHVGVTV